MMMFAHDDHQREPFDDLSERRAEQEEGKGNFG